MDVGSRDILMLTISQEVEVSADKKRKIERHAVGNTKVSETQDSPLSFAGPNFPIEGYFCFSSDKNVSGQ